MYSAEFITGQTMKVHFKTSDVKYKKGMCKRLTFVLAGDKLDIKYLLDTFCKTCLIYLS